MSGPQCRACGCTDAACRGCIERTGEACWWVEPDLCSACAAAAEDAPVLGVDVCDHGIDWDQDCEVCESELAAEDASRVGGYCQDCGANADAGRATCRVCGGPIVGWVE